MAVPSQRRFHYEIENLGDLSNKFLVVKLGSRDYPATEECLVQMQKIVSEALDQHFKNTKERPTILITHHAVSIEKMDVKEGDTLLVKVGDAERPAIEDDLVDQCESLKRVFGSRNINFYVTHHAIEIYDKDFSEKTMARMKEWDKLDEQHIE